MFMHTLISGALLATLGVGEPGEPVHGSWAAWHGCWRAVDATAETGGLLCVLPGRDAAEARMLSVADGAVRGSITVRADGVGRPVAEGGCAGTELAQWSRDGRRVYMRAELECDGMHRTSTGALALVAEDEWVDVQAATVSGQHATRSIRYVAVPIDLAPAEIRAQLDDSRRLAREAARLRASAPLHVEDILEAASTLAEPALHALLAAHRIAFHPDAATLVRLDQAGLPGTAIDIVVALGYPHRFALRESAGEPVIRGVASSDTVECYDPVLDLYLYGDDCTRRGYGRSRHHGHGYGYSPWGYDHYGWRYGSRPIVIVQPEPGEPRRSGQVVKGAGYTRGDGSGRGTAQPRSESNGPQPPAEAGTSAAGSGSGGSGTTSGGAARSGDSGASSTRTAKPRETGSDSSGSSGSSSSGSTSSGASSTRSDPPASSGSDTPRTARRRDG